MLRFLNNIRCLIACGLIIMLCVCSLSSCGRSKDVSNDGNNISQGTSVYDKASYEDLKNVLSGKGISILGDGISTYKGWSNNAFDNYTISENSFYYCNSSGDVSEVQETWWLQATTAAGLDLVVNNSCSTGEVSALGASRAQQLHNNEGREPDIIAVYIGINDWRNAKSVEEFRSAYSDMISDMTRRYVGKDLYLFTLISTSDLELNSRLVAFNDIIKDVATQYNCTLVNLYNDTGINASNASSYMIDGQDFPNSLCMDLITKCFLDSLKKNYVTEIKVTNLTYIGDLRYNVTDVAPVLRLAVRYSNGATEDIEISDDMYVIDDTHTIPDFKKDGDYQIKLTYKGASIELKIEVVDSQKCILIENNEFLYGAYFDHNVVGYNNRITTGEYAKIKSADALHPAQDITIKVSAADVGNYRVTLGYFDKNGNYTGRTDILNMINGELSIKKSEMSGEYFRVNVYIYTGRFTKVPESTNIVVYNEKFVPSNQLGAQQPFINWAGKKITILGDSISATGYPGILGEMAGAKVQNLSISGLLLSGGITSMVDRVAMDTDLVIVYGGTNDYWQKRTSIGTPDSLDPNTYYGALRYIFNYLREHNPDAQILFIFPPEQFYGGSTSDTDFGYGTLGDFRAAFLDFCNKNNINYMNLSQTKFDSNIHSTDGLHPNAAGHLLLAELIYCEICF